MTKKNCDASSTTHTYPIIFSGPMVRALLEGRKTQTRRLITSQWANLKMHHELGDRCLLWVRESAYFRPNAAAYAADNAPLRPGERVRGWGRLTPSIHMPRWASRLTLEITDVRLQRLQDISEVDAIQEGATCRPNCSGFQSMFPGWSMDWNRVGEPSRWAADGEFLAERDLSLGSARSAFGSFINYLHGGPRWNQKGVPLWDQNPEVFALTFRISQQNVDAFIKQRVTA